MARPRRPTDKQVNRMISHSAGVQRQMDRTARRVEGNARENLARRYRTGSHQIYGVRGKTDRYIFMTGPGSLALEVGHWLVYFGRKTSTYISGKRILRDALRR